MVMTDQPTAPLVLNTSESWSLLRDEAVGRLAVVVDDQPEIFPVNYLVDHGSIVFRTAAGAKLTASIDRLVAFEVDAYDPANGEAWSVVVKGTAREVNRLHDVLDALELPLFPWHAAPKPCIVRIEPNSISGRRFHAVTAGRPMLTAPSRAAHE